jgi:hypothetical protein
VGIAVVMATRSGVLCFEKDKASDRYEEGCGMVWEQFPDPTHF